MIQAKVMADSISEAGDRITTLQIRVHRYVWGEFLTHRCFSRNASSTRATPVLKMLKQVWNDPAIPVIWGSNKAGMQAGNELQGIKKWLCRTLWKWAGRSACVFAYLMMIAGLHKQWANRILEPWQWINSIVSSTEWDNFFCLRIHPDAQPEMMMLAVSIKTAIEQSTPILLTVGQWHLPYVTNDKKELIGDNQILAAMSAASCARVSHLKHDKTEPSIEEDLALCEKLTKSRPIHASPFEHQATPMAGRHGNFTGWKQQRQLIEEDLAK